MVSFCIETDGKKSVVCVRGWKQSNNSQKARLLKLSIAKRIDLDASKFRITFWHSNRSLPLYIDEVSVKYLDASKHIVCVRKQRRSHIWFTTTETAIIKRCLDSKFNQYKHNNAASSNLNYWQLWCNPMYLGQKPRKKRLITTIMQTFNRELGGCTRTERSIRNKLMHMIRNSPRQ